MQIHTSQKKLVEEVQTNHGLMKAAEKSELGPSRTELQKHVPPGPRRPNLYMLKTKEFKGEEKTGLFNLLTAAFFVVAAVFYRFQFKFGCYCAHKR